MFVTVKFVVPTAIPHAVLHVAVIVVPSPTRVLMMAWLASGTVNVVGGLFWPIAGIEVRATQKKRKLTFLNIPPPLGSWGDGGPYC
jgi:hypothetical protein